MPLSATITEVVQNNEKLVADSVHGNGGKLNEYMRSIYEVLADVELSERTAITCMADLRNTLFVHLWLLRFLMLAQKSYLIISLEEN